MAARGSVARFVVSQPPPPEMLDRALRGLAASTKLRRLREYPAAVPATATVQAPFSDDVRQSVDNQAPYLRLESIACFRQCNIGVRRFPIP
jgi:hypothetical protein